VSAVNPLHSHSVALKHLLLIVLRKTFVLRNTGERYASDLTTEDEITFMSPKTLSV